jgi:hypothetical protein
MWPPPLRRVPFASFRGISADSEVATPTPPEPVEILYLPESPGAGREPRQPEQRQHQRHIAVAGAEPRPDRLVRHRARERPDRPPLRMIASRTIPVIRESDA